MRQPKTWVASLAVIVACACAPAPDDDAIDVKTTVARLEADPGPPPHEQPRRFTLWHDDGAGFAAAGRVIAASGDGRAQVDVAGVLRVEGQVVAADVQPPLVEDGRGRLAFARGVPPARDVWVVEAGVARAVTADGMSDRPFFLPDGSLLWVGSVDGRARWVWEGVVLDGSAASAPPPAWPERTRWDAAAGAVVYDAGDGAWLLWPARSAAAPREGE